MFRLISLGVIGFRELGHSFLPLLGLLLEGSDEHVSVQVIPQFSGMAFKLSSTPTFT